MVTVEEQMSAKREELETLKKITELTNTMKSQLDELSDQVGEIEASGESIANVVKLWDSVTQSISAAGLGLLRYGEKDYKVGQWSEDAEKKKEADTMPFPEGLVRVNKADLEK
ncbi:Dad2p KNAG_0M01870 [Huiozyma naganishii CBS 8797]|uniref:DASH complex subunit DAD2 n=1 Tax=Huiozyma naganishii (strain ATCC MYA-139 / BCRC 22969 / CBS 8797 / KCTC 17520 / NBRC 10181 / NCYC 3082 / Yp74L-3) TaxID=1071383 RepID=J7RDX8_HUIN7|nr:hypothetical protein KNAG_0M01870 [Kazachstania naganishii CBS 8797]CCK73040.1 hypothetical protein KNAG_0M01870 [Kazachstania naganishii CBS 8797]